MHTPHAHTHAHDLIYGPSPILTYVPHGTLPSPMSPVALSPHLCPHGTPLTYVPVALSPSPVSPMALSPHLCPPWHSPLTYVPHVQQAPIAGFLQPLHISTITFQLCRDGKLCPLRHTQISQIHTRTYTHAHTHTHIHTRTYTRKYTHI